MFVCSLLIARCRRIMLAIAIAMGVVSCATYNEELGRNQILLGDPQAFARSANAAWTQIKQKERISTKPRYTSRLNRVAPRLLSAIGENPANWEYLVFDSEDLNAFALPGNKIGMYEGIMDIMENDAQLAAVVGHEIAHVEYLHSQERYGQQTLGQLGAVAAGVAVGSRCDERDTACRKRALSLAGTGASVFFLLPHSRKHEYEADIGGLRYMVKARYNPCEAVKFWQNLLRASAGKQRPPEFLSTHPEPQNRIALLRREAQKMGYNCG